MEGDKQAIFSEVSEELGQRQECQVETRLELILRLPTSPKTTKEGTGEIVQLICTVDSTVDVKLVN